MENVSCVKKKGHWKSKWTLEKGPKAHFIQHQTRTHAQALQVKRSRSFSSKCCCMIVCLQLSAGGAAGGTGQEGGSGPSQEAAGLHAESAGAGRRKTNGTESAVSDVFLIGCFRVLHLLLSPQKKLPLMLLSISMAESLKDFDAESSIRWQVWCSTVHPSIHPSIHALDLTANNWLQSCEKPHDCSTLAFSFGWKRKRIPLTVYNLWPLSLVMSFIWNVQDPPAFL